MTVVVVPTRRYRVIRGANGHYRAHYFRTKAARDRAAAAFAKVDRQIVITELWSAEHPQDELNAGWACDGTADPP